MNKNKTLRVATSLMLVASTAAVAVAPTQTDAATKKKPTLKSKFTDVKKGDYFHDAVVTLTDERVLNGYGDQTFRPNVPTTRGHIAIVLTRVLGLEASQYVNIQDMPTTHDTYDYAAAAIIHGLMETDQYNNFNPKNELSRYEYAEILTRAYNLTPTYKKKHKFKNVPEQYEIAVQTVFDHGLMKGVSTTDFGGYQNITRGQMAVTLINARKLGEVKPSEPTYKGQYTTEILSYNTKTNKIITTDGEFEINAKLRPLFTNNNKPILQNAIINGEFAGNELLAIQDLEIVQSSFASNQTIASLKSNAIATTSPFNPSNPFITANTVANMAVLDLGGITILGKIILKRDSVSIRNGSAGQIIVTDESDTALYLANVKVKDLIVQYGYYRDFLLQLENSTANRVQIDRDDVNLKSNTKLPQLVLTDNVYIIDLQAAIGLLEIMKDGYATLVGLISIDRLLVADEAYVYIGSAGYVKAAEILARGGEISFGSNVRLGVVTIPPGAGDYKDYFNYYGDLKNVIGKVMLPGSDQNLFHDVIQLPSKEEIQREELFAKLVDRVAAEGSRNQFSFISSINSYSTSMRDYSVNMSFVVTSGLTQLNNSDIVPTTITFRGKTSTQNFTVAQLRSGFSLSSMFGAMTLKDLAPNNDNRVNIEFDTPYPLTVRGGLAIKNQSKGVAEASLNSQYAEEIKTLINTLTAQSIPGGVQIDKRYGTIGNEFDKVSEDVRIQLTQLRNPTVDSQVIPFKLTYSFNGQDKNATFTNVTLAQLKNGVSLYSLIGMADKKMAKDDVRKIETWTVQFSETIDADFKALALVNGSEVKSSTFKINFDKPVAKALNSMKASASPGKVVVTKRYNKLDETMYNKPNDLKMTLTGATVPTSTTTAVPFTVKYQLSGGTAQTKEITDQTVANLTSGVSLYSLLGLNVPLSANLSDKIETVEIEFKGAIKGTLKFDAIVNGAVEISETANIDVKEAVTPSVKELAMTQTNRGFKVVQTYGTIQKAAEGRKADLKLKLTSVTKPTKEDEDKIAFKIKYQYNNGTTEVKEITDKTVKDLKAGISLYTLAEKTVPNLAATHSDKVVSFEIEFQHEVEGNFQVTSEVDSEQNIIKTQTVKYEGVAIESLKANTTQKGLTIEQQFANPITENFLNKASDVMLKLISTSTNIPGDTKVPFKINYYPENATAPTIVDVTEITVEELKANNGVSLYKLLDANSATKELKAELNDKTDKFEIEFDGNMIGKFRVNSLVGNTLVKQSPEIDVKVTENATPNQLVATLDGNGFTLERTFSAFDDLIIDTPIDVQLFVTGVQNLYSTDTVKVAVERELGQDKTEKIIDISISDLNNGKSLYDIIGIKEPKLAEAQKGIQEKWTVRFLELIDANFEVKTYQGGYEVGTTTPINDLELDFKNVYGIDSFAANGTTIDKLTVTTTFGTASAYDEVKKYPLDASIKVTKGLENEDLKREVKFKIKQNTTDYGEFKLSLGQLKTGIRLSEILKQKNSNLPISLLGSHVNRTDGWEISFENAYFNTLEANVSLLVNNKVVKTIKEIKLESSEGRTLSNLVNEFKLTYDGTTAPNEFTTNLKFTNNTTVADPYKDLGVDARLKITSTQPLKQQTYAVTITVDSVDKKVNVTKDQLLAGVELSTLMGVTPAKLSQHGETATWQFKVEPVEDETVDFKIDLLFGDYPVRTEERKDFKIEKPTTGSGTSTNP